LSHPSAGPVVEVSGLVRRYGDLVAANLPPVEGYETYCRERLGLGEVEWIAPQASRFRRNLAGHCWTSRAIRKRLIRAVKSEDLREIHPLGKSPLLRDGDVVLAESGAIVDHLVTRHGQGRLAPHHDDPGWPR